MGMIETFRSVVRFKPIELDPVQRRLATAASVEDLRREEDRVENRVEAEEETHSEQDDSLIDVTDVSDT